MRGTRDGRQPSEEGREGRLQDNYTTHIHSFTEYKEHCTHLHSVLSVVEEANSSDVIEDRIRSVIDYIVSHNRWEVGTLWGGDNGWGSGRGSDWSRG